MLYKEGGSKGRETVHMASYIFHEPWTSQTIFTILWDGESNVRCFVLIPRLLSELFFVEDGFQKNVPGLPWWCSG